MKRKKLAVLSRVIALALFFSNFGMEPVWFVNAATDPEAVSGVTLNENAVTLSIGETSTLIPTITPDNAANKNVTWNSDNPAIATVTDGLVTGASEGTATIMVTTEDGAKTALCIVTVTAHAPPASKTFDLIGITDFHGQLLNSSNTLHIGAALTKAVKDIKALNPERTLIIGGGDLYQGTPVSNVLHGVPVQQTFSNMGMEVTALGNHEFDWGLNVINNETMPGASYKIVCANLYNKTTGDRVYEPYKVFHKDGVRIAVIGAITEESPSIILPANVADFEFTDAAAEITTVAALIRANNEADIVLATIHEGGSQLPVIVSELKGVDAVFGGHSHTILNKLYPDSDGKEIPVVIANYSGKGYIDLKMTVAADNTVTFDNATSSYKSLTVTADTPLDPEIKAIVEEANADLAPIFNEVIGYDAAAYTKDQLDSPYGESQLGNWMADVVKNYADADVGMVNNGGIRLSPIPAGNITVGTIFNLMPFDNTVTTVNMTGAQLKYILEQAVQDNGKGIQISGVKFVYDSTKQSGQRVQSITRESDGTAVNDIDMLVVAAPDFVATGGDGFTGFLVPAIKASYVDSHYTVRDALIADVRATGRITVVMNNRVDNQMAAVNPVAMSIAEARTTSLKAVILTGTVSAVSGNNIFMQDDAAGICVYNSGGKVFSAKKGDKIKVTGNLSVYNGLLEVTPASAADVVLISSGNVVTPKVVTVGQISDALQGQLIQVKN
ncbi:MAG: 5'-nucleotidase C-terminal domain-containing protein, partial [Bacillota bacterium]